VIEFDPEAFVVEFMRSEVIADGVFTIFPTGKTLARRDFRNRGLS